MTDLDQSISIYVMNGVEAPWSSSIELALLVVEQLRSTIGEPACIFQLEDDWVEDASGHGGLFWRATIEHPGTASMIGKTPAEAICKAVWEATGEV